MKARIDDATSSEIERAIQAIASHSTSTVPSLPYLSTPPTPGKTSKLAQHLRQVFDEGFTPTPEETSFGSKGGHATRPIALWDVPTRIAYHLYTDRVDPHLSESSPSVNWDEFQRLPLNHKAPYVVSTDISAFYQYIDHDVLRNEVGLQTNDSSAASGATHVAQCASGRRFGLPQQNTSSDRLANFYAAKLDRALIRAGYTSYRYNDDFRILCQSWSECVRALETLSMAAKQIGLTLNEGKTRTWKMAHYEKSLSSFSDLRSSIASDAKIELTRYEITYDDFIEVPPSKSEIERASAIEVLRRWNSVAGRGVVTARNSQTHRALLQLIPTALHNLQGSSDTILVTEVLKISSKLLRFEQQLTPAVARYLAGIHGETAWQAISTHQKKGYYLSDWQKWWLVSCLNISPGVLSGKLKSDYITWLTVIKDSGNQSSLLKATATLNLAPHGAIGREEIQQRTQLSTPLTLGIYAAALALMPGNTSKQQGALRSGNLEVGLAIDWALAHGN